VNITPEVNQYGSLYLNQKKEKNAKFKQQKGDKMRITKLSSGINFELETNDYFVAYNAIKPLICKWCLRDARREAKKYINEENYNEILLMETLNTACGLEFRFDE